MKLAYIYPCPGELGWVAFNFTPHVRYVLLKEGPFDSVVACVRDGWGALYRFATTITSFDYYPDVGEGNAFVLHKPEAYNTYKAHCAKCDKHVKKLRKEGHEVVIIRLPTSQYRYHRYKLRHRKFEVLTPNNGHLEQWQDKIEPDAVIFHLRHISRSTKKNTPHGMYQAVAKWAKHEHRQFVTIGKTLGCKPSFSISGINLLNKTTLEDVVTIFNLGGLVVGSSSGPMHMASLTRTPHVVWGGHRGAIRERYVKHWNMFKTPVDHLTLNFRVDKSTLVKAVAKMAKNPMSNAKRRKANAVC